jgi:hypothetical protein
VAAWRATAGVELGAQQAVLDVTHPGGSGTPLTAYRRGLEIIRAATGPEGDLLGCGAPILPSVGLVDAMRVSPDTAPAYEPADGGLRSSAPPVRRS